MRTAMWIPNWQEPASIRRCSLPSDELHVWRIDLRQPETALPFFRQVLSPVELERADRLRTVDGRTEFVTSRFALRHILARYSGRAPAALRFGYGPHGKPYLSENSLRLEFNLSHTSGLGLLAVAVDRAVGIDVEHLHAALDWAKIAERFYAPEERAALTMVPTSLRQTAFTQYWTAKEAYVKATGLGLSIPLHSFSISVTERVQLLQANGDPGAALRWLFGQFCPAPDYVATLAVQGPMPPVSWYSWSPPSNTPQPLAPP